MVLPFGSRFLGTVSAAPTNRDLNPAEVPGEANSPVSSTEARRRHRALRLSPKRDGEHLGGARLSRQRGARSLPAQLGAGDTGGLSQTRETCVWVSDLPLRP